MSEDDALTCGLGQWTRQNCHLGFAFQSENTPHKLLPRKPLVPLAEHLVCTASQKQGTRKVCEFLATPSLQCNPWILLPGGSRQRSVTRHRNSNTLLGDAGHWQECRRFLA